MFFEIFDSLHPRQSPHFSLISMTKHRPLADSQVTLNLSIPRDSDGAEISQARSMLTQLPSINQLKLDGGIFFKVCVSFTFLTFTLIISEYEKDIYGNLNR